MIDTYMSGYKFISPKYNAVTYKNQKFNMIFRYSLMTSVGLSAERGQGPTVLEAAKMAFEIGLEVDILASSVTLSIKGS